MSNNIYSVSQINTYIERMFADDYMLSSLSISGEVSNCKYNHTGHIYFTLKDDKAAISCVMFAGSKVKGLKFDMRDGDAVVVSGYVGVYSAAGRYQVYAKEIKKAGQGDLYLRYEALKQELEESGMFDAMYKKPLPAHACRIGIVTAPTGAAVHDIITVSKKRNPYVELILYPAQVQGQGAAESIVNGIRTLDALGLDVLIVGRGGGSIEDLWAFNEEIVARAIFSCNTPVISAVGHETDFTIADFVADVRAATPSQGAELANFLYSDFKAGLQRYSDRLDMLLDNRLRAYDQKLYNFSIRLKALRPDNKINQNQDRLDNLRVRLVALMDKKLTQSQNRLALLSGSLEGLSPAKKLSAGFGYITDDKGDRIDSVSQTDVGNHLIIRMADGVIESQVCSIKKD